MRILTILSICSTALIAGCAANQPKYYWGDYSSSLYDYYRDSTAQPQYVAALNKIANEPNKENRKVPPGILAEYGYIELSQGRVESAISYFEREKQAWPESKAMMDKVIASARAKGKAEPISGDASASAVPNS